VPASGGHPSWVKGAVLSVGLAIDDITTPLDVQSLFCYIMYIRAASEGRGPLRFSVHSPLPGVQQLMSPVLLDAILAAV
jgi:hypothetical protein